MKLITKAAITLGLSIAVVATAAFSASHVSKPQADSVKARQGQMQLIGYHTGILGAMAKGEAEYDAAKATSAAKNLNAAASFDRASLWLEGTEQGVADDNRAKAEIWTDAAGFDAKFMALQDASAAMIDAAGTDLDSLKVAMGDIGKACGACHDDYRGPKN
ncbi:Cytochrome c556 [Sulfitobacter brevis]|uniref:Cytochrome c556 n=1 Tax=Sulfitobacter brevis TaxID=74348 RepID=A0A1I1UXG0_9RHOB|nr:cytochrome c [Sulfitobacter brevis]SFD75319.1 Cytochrome c556 [Sulfitobacter brevis]